MEGWLLLSLVVAALWGLWGFALKYASLSLEWHYVYLASVVGLLIAHITAISFLIFTGLLNSLPSHGKGFIVGVLGGLMGALGGLLMIVALKLGEASVVVPLTSLYPAITAMLSILLLKESASIFKVVGVFLAVIAIILLSLHGK